MSLRIAYCSYFIREFFREHSKTLKGKERENEHGEYTFFRFRQCCPSNKVRPTVGSERVEPSTHSTCTPRCSLRSWSHLW
jgi:hypothetical protein